VPRVKPRLIRQLVEHPCLQIVHQACEVSGVGGSARAAGEQRITLAVKRLALAGHVSGREAPQGVRWQCSNLLAERQRLLAGVEHNANDEAVA
jgi:hypothetical protein